MFRKIIFVMSVVVLSLMMTLSALAAAPAQGIVVEGQSVPGVALGDSRAQVEASYGQPVSCQNMSYYDGRQGLDGICRFDVEGGGRITVYFFDADGGPAQGSADDVVSIIRWPQPVSGWVTTAGVNTTLALADPDAVIAAYPNAVVTYNSVFGNIESIEDKALGILVDYSFEYLSGTLSVNMVIRFPSEPAPVPQKETRVTDIDLAVKKVKGDRQVRALVRVEDERGRSASGATVFATWVFPDGSTQALDDLTSGTGYAYFEILDAPRGTLTLRVDNVVLDGYQFDRSGSVLSASTTVK
ncbi:MAG: hypothetical protein P8X95_20450 [Anaerolineales bacterium]|jgi:hypothetical protein